MTASNIWMPTLRPRGWPWCCHWGGASARLGLPFAHLLPAWRVIAPSLRGHGRNPPPVAAANRCGQDVLRLLRHLGVRHIDRLYAYSLGAYVATRLFVGVEIANAVLVGGGVVPFGVAMPDAFAPPSAESPETEPWLGAVRAAVEVLGRASEEVAREWAMVYAILDDILDLSQPRLTFRLDTEAMRPAIESIWHNDYFAAPPALPHCLRFVNTNDPLACHPYVERFTQHPGCAEVALDEDPFDPRWSVVRRVIEVLEA
jgi:pimeloyl-ACP methyl ester carboxylesterase